MLGYGNSRIGVIEALFCVAWRSGDFSPTEVLLSVCRCHPSCYIHIHFSATDEQISSEYMRAESGEFSVSPLLPLLHTLGIPPSLPEKTKRIIHTFTPPFSFSQARNPRTSYINASTLHPHSPRPQTNFPLSKPPLHPQKKKTIKRTVINARMKARKLRPSLDIIFMIHF